MGAPVLLLALTLFPVAAAASLEPHYMVVLPAVIHHSQDEKLYIHLRSLTEAVHLAVTLEVTTQNHTLVEQDVEKPGTFQCITFQVPELIPRKRNDSTSHPEKVVFLHVLIHSGDNVLFEGRKKVLVKPQKNVILVETDKSLYKPGETVKFRIVNLDEDLKVIKNGYSQIWLEDPEYNRIAEWLNVKSRHGIVDLSFPLASKAPLGEYTISVQQDMVQKTFTVDEYVLKKIELQIEHPPFITTAEEEFQLKVCSKYTYGKPVQGKIGITFITLSQFSEGNLSSSTEMRKQNSWTNKDGCTTFTVKTETLELNETNSYVIVIGEMVEDGTGAETKEISGIPVATRMKSIEFINIHPFYKRGLPYTGKMFCHSNESPLRHETVYLTVDVNDEERHLSFLTDENGEVHFSLDTTSWNGTLVSLKGTYNLGNYDEQDSSESYPGVEDSFHWLKSFYSESNSFLEIKARNNVMPCDQEQEVQVDYILDRNKLSSEAEHIDFYYLVIAKGKILFSGEKQMPIIQHENLQGSFSLTLTIGNDFLPDIKLLLYAVFLDGEVVADVEEFQVEKCFRHKVALDFSHKEEVPGSRVSLDLKAAPGSLCSVQAVDKSVLLKNNNTLTADTLYEKIFDDSFVIGGRGFPNHLEDFEAYPCLPQQSSLHKKTQMGAPWYQSDGDVFNLFKLLCMKILTNTRIKKPVSCMQPGFEKKKYSGKDILLVLGANTMPTCACTPHHTQMRTTLAETPELKLDACPDCRFTSCLCANEAKTFEWNVIATRLGKVNVTVSSMAEDSHNLCDNRIAVTPLQGERDTVIKPLLVKPGGVLQEKTQNAFLCTTDNTVSEEFSLMLPAEVLEGSGRASFSVIGEKGFPCSWVPSGRVSTML
ncbi:alpha-2-macroglobulin-like protein 1 isoform X2 [Grus americana]|uniref:alpha-2-macroglobulin-like protein 1 isoform X2 n=1 Tax=Grus americana TaxID=9117 RepID=UPI0024086CBB|nr:alpha-2-macroglobulin-like protein 1 isoform X2 [Grus americana]